MLETQDIVIGIDGGGTHTRVMVSDLQGNILSYLEKGPASVHKDLRAQENVNQAILEALATAGKRPEQVRGLAAGIAGYDSEDDLIWVKSLTAIDGLNCPRWHFNDAVAAHYGALLTRSGIVALSGTGSIIMGLTEDGQCIRNFDFHHYTGSGARFIAYDVTYEILAGNTGPTDLKLIQFILKHWEVSTVLELSRLGFSGFRIDRRERERKFEQCTPFITEAAALGSTLAKRVCDRAIQQIKVGIEMIAPFFSGDNIPVTFIGSVINCNYFNTNLSELLKYGNNKQFTVVNSFFNPVTGSVLYAISKLPGYSIDDSLINNLHKSVHTHF